jgi:uncharacterized protein YndB with AHSA1/START domain
MPATTTATEGITRQVHIAAKPETVYAFLADPERLASWMGRRVQAEARPGGILRVDYNGFDVMRGSFVELVPHSKVVWSWGWESLSATQTPPGASTVEITLEPDGDGTLLKLRHSGLRGEDIASHSAGWDMTLARISDAIAGRPLEAMGAELTPAGEYASQLNTLLIRVVETVEGCSDDAWRRPVASDGRSVGVVANHIAGHIGLAHFTAATANGERSPLADFTGEVLEQMNAEDARQSANVTRAEVVAKLREAGPAGVAALRAIPAAGLAKTQPMAFAGGAALSASALAEGPLLADIRGHLAGIEAAIAG